MGLLDPTDDPRTMGLLSLGLGLLNSRGNFGQALGQAGPQALQVMQQVKDRQMLMQDRQQQQAMRDLQMQQAQAQLAEIQRQQKEREQLQALAQQFARSPEQQAMANGQGPTVANAAAIPTTAPGYDFNGYANALAGLDPMKALQMRQLTQKDNTPIKLGAGEALLEPGTFRQLFKNPDKDSTPSAIKEYQFAQQQGYGGTFQQFQTELKKAGATSLNVNTDSLGLKPKDRFEMEGKLADDYKGVTKLDSLVLDATRKIKTALAQGGAMKDQAAIYSFAKMLDPEGAVREADYAAISNTAGLIDRIKNYLNKMATGEQLNPTQREEMAGLMNAFEGVAMRRIGSAQADFSSRAKRYNLNPDDVFSGSVKPEPASAAPARPSGPIKRWNPTAQKFE